MTSEAWNRIREELATLLELPESTRAPHLAKLRESDPDIAIEVESLLANESALDADLAPPAHLDRIDAYELLGEIGRGGTSIVYAARKQGLDRTVALKLILNGADHSSLSDAFRREQSALAALRHPAIVTLLDGGVTGGGLPYLVLERVNGVAIDAYCQANAESPREVAGLFVRLCEGVGAAHAIGIVHRDLKPGNVLVDTTGAPRLLDFGVALTRLPGNGTQPSAMTIAYASPEQLTGAAITPASDVYSLGVLLYELVTGKSPYIAVDGSLVELITAICEQPPAPITAYFFQNAKHRPDAALNAIIAKCLEKSPGRRYPTAAALGDELRNWLAGRPIAAAPPGWRLPSALRRRWMTVAAVAAGLVLVGFAIWHTAGESAARQSAESEAKQHRETAARMVRAVLEEIDDAVDRGAELPAARKRLIRETLASLQSLRARGEDAELLYQLGLAYQEMSRLWKPEDGGTDAALRASLEAHRCFFRLHEAEPDSVLYRFALGRNFLQMAEVFGAANDLGGVNAVLLEARRYAKALPVEPAYAGFVQTVERLQAAAELRSRYDHLSGPYAGNDLMRAADVLHLAEVELRNGITANAERLYGRARKLITGDPKTSRLLVPSPTGPITARIDEQRKILLAALYPK